MDAAFLLRKHGLRVTQFRKEVLSVLNSSSTALDNRGLEDALHPADRVTIYRTLRSFEDSGIIHRIPDPSGNVKFALCHGHCDEHAHHDSHAHFHCQGCNATLCLEGTPVSSSSLHLPTGFSVTEIHITVSGKCPDCQ